MGDVFKRTPLRAGEMTNLQLIAVKQAEVCCTSFPQSFGIYFLLWPVACGFPPRRRCPTKLSLLRTRLAGPTQAVAFL